MTAPPPASSAEPVWRRVHRVTPLLTAWRVAAALVAVVLFQIFDDLVRTTLPGLVLVGIIGGVILVAGLVSLAYSYLAWRRLSYAITSDAVVLRSGVLFRRERVSRLTRIQSVEVTQPILGRLFGFAALRVESAGAGESALVLAYLTQSEATAVRNEVLARAAGIDLDGAPAPAADAPGAAGPPVLAAPGAADAAVLDVAPEPGTPRGGAAGETRAAPSGTAVPGATVSRARRGPSSGRAPARALTASAQAPRSHGSQRTRRMST